MPSELATALAVAPICGENFGNGLRSRQPSDAFTALVERLFRLGDAGRTTPKAFTIGADEGQGLRLYNPRIATRHAQVVRSSEGKLWLKDVGSRTGTTVNGFHVTPGELTRLRPGDEVVLGGAGGEVLHVPESAYANRTEPRGSLESTEHLLGEVWHRFGRTGRRVHRGTVYDLYTDALRPNPLGDASVYRERVVALASVANQHPELFAAGQDDLPIAEAARDSFVHFVRRGEAGATQRVYVNPTAGQAPAVLRRLLRDVLADPLNFPGVFTAKIGGSSLVGTRPEGIVIYTQSKAASERVLTRLKTYQAVEPEDFSDGGPPFTEPVAPGLSRCEEPGWQAEGKSFGSIRSQAIAGALDGASTEAEFRTRVEGAFRRYGIDPERPSDNLPWS